MPQLVILSGKGGTGKTSLSACLAHLAAESCQGPAPILVDADVDAANLELLLDARCLERKEFLGGSTAVIDQARCQGCGRCREICRFHAIEVEQGSYRVDSIACEGCAACLYECPESAVTLQEMQAGEWFISETPFGQLFHAHLFPAQENSGKLVALLKREAREAWESAGADWMLVDGPPGIGCPVISAISGADGILAVAEPSLAGIHDLKRVLETAGSFQVPAWICINKADLAPEGSRSIREIAQQRGAVFLGEIPYDLDLPRALSAGEPVTAYNPGAAASRAIQSIWRRIGDQALNGAAGRKSIKLQTLKKD